MDGRTVRAVTLVIDKNPAPLAAVFRLSPDAGDPGIATRVRVNEYTDIRAVAEMDDGSLRAVSTVVKAAGGCRSDERRVGKECVSTCSSTWSPYHLKKKNYIPQQSNTLN